MNCGELLIMLAKSIETKQIKFGNLSFYKYLNIYNFYLKKVFFLNQRKFCMQNFI